jgi:hypothetical protein
VKDALVGADVKLAWIIGIEEQREDLAVRKSPVDGYPACAAIPAAEYTTAVGGAVERLGVHGIDSYRENHPDKRATLHMDMIGTGGCGQGAKKTSCDHCTQE